MIFVLGFVFDDRWRLNGLYLKNLKNKRHQKVYFGTTLD